jgi:hypothetical protein
MSEPTWEAPTLEGRALADLGQQLAAMRAERDASRAEVAEARRTAQFHKDNHLAAEAEVARKHAALQHAAQALANARHLLAKYGDTQAHPWLASFERDMGIVQAALAAQEGDRG